MRRSERVDGHVDTPLSVRETGGALWLSMNRPQRRNALDHSLGAALVEALTFAATSDEVRVVVLTGGGGAFCAGDDIDAVRAHVMGDSTDLPADRSTGEAHYLRAAQLITEMPKPVVAGINGPAFGAGLELACAADVRIAQDGSAVFGSGLVKLGHAGTAVFLPRVVGPATATWIYMTGSTLTAPEAHRLGLVHEVLPAASYHARVNELATFLAAGPTRAIGLFKSLREAGMAVPVAELARRQTEAHNVNNADIRDGLEGLQAFLEHRAPRFTGR